MSILNKFKKKAADTKISEGNQITELKMYKSHITENFEKRPEFESLAPKQFREGVKPIGHEPESQSRDTLEKILAKLEVISAQNETKIELLREISMSLRYRTERRY